MPVLLCVLGLLLGLGFIWGLFVAARHGHPRVELHSAGMTFRHGLPLKVFAVVSLIGAETAFGAWAILNPADARRYAVPLILAATSLGLAGLLLCWESFRFALHVSPAGLDCRSPWTGRRVEPWHNLLGVEYSPGNCWFILRFLEGRTFHVSAVVPGVWRLLEEFEKRLKPDQLQYTESGYWMLGRGWPFRPEQFTKPTRVTRIHWLRWAFLTFGMLVLLTVFLFTINGMFLAERENAVCDRFSKVKLGNSMSQNGYITVVSYNLAKGWAPRGNFSFASTAEVEKRLSDMAKVIAPYQPDLVFLSEVMTECSPCPVNQVERIAGPCGLPFFAFGENYNVGLPFYRVVGGNAILSRRKMIAEKNISLSGRKVFFDTHNSRRALFASLDINEKRVWLGSLHNDSFDPANNVQQVRQILQTIDDRPCLLCGDFNAQPDSESMRLLKESGRFTGAWDGPATFPEKNIRIDYILGPASWKHIKTEVLPGDASDHRAVLSVFKVNENP